jgi:hypothetical protein
MTPAANLPPVSVTNWKEKIYLYIDSLLKGDKKIKIFLIEVFFYLSPVSMTPVVHLKLGVSSRIFEKIPNGPNGILWGWGETDS